MKISIIILTYNSQEYIEKCVQSVISQNMDEIELIVVDNASQDQTIELVHKLGYPFKLIQNSKNLGVAKSRNLGVRASSGKYVLFLDDDAYLTENSLTSLMEYMGKNPKVGLIGPKLLYLDGTLQPSCRKFPSLWPLFLRGTSLNKLFPNSKSLSAYLMEGFDHTKEQIVDWVMGACQLIRRDLFDQLGYLDERYFFAYEDIDFCYRLKKNGWEVKYVPFVMVYHKYQRRSAQKGITKAKLQHIKSILIFFAKHFPLHG